VKRREHYQERRAHADGWEVWELFGNKKFIVSSFTPDGVYEIEPDKDGWIPFYATEDSVCPVDDGQKISIDNNYPEHIINIDEAGSRVWSNAPRYPITRYRLVEDTDARYSQSAAAEDNGQWELKKPEMDQIYWFKNGSGAVTAVIADTWLDAYADVKRLDYGNVYLSEAEAYADAETDRKHNRMRAWLRENDDGRVADWSDGEQRNWVVVFKHQTKEWAASCVHSLLIGIIYMSKPNAEKLRDLLNSGEVAL
jgi:hypothetical protein